MQILITVTSDRNGFQMHWSMTRPAVTSEFAFSLPVIEQSLEEIRAILCFNFIYLCLLLQKRAQKCICSDFLSHLELYKFITQRAPSSFCLYLVINKTDLKLIRDHVVN